MNATKTTCSWYDGNGWYDGFTNQGDEFGDNYDYEMVEEMIREICGQFMDVEVQNFGWNNMNGSVSHVSTVCNPLASILPNCECSFKIRVDGQRLQIDNSHHDSPVGGEIYTITKG